MKQDRPTSRVTVAALVATVLVTVTTLLLVAFGAWTYRSERDRRMAQLLSGIDVEADQLAVSLALPIWNIDRAQIGKILEGLDGVPEIEGVIVNGGGTTHAMTRNAGWQLVPSNAYPDTGELLLRNRDIFFSGERIGSVRILATPRFVDAELQHVMLSTMSMIVGVDLLLILVVWLVLWRAVLRPLVSIEKFAVAVSQESAGCAVVPTGIGFAAELESVRSSIETMVRLLDERYTELQEQVARRSESEERFRTIFDSVNDAILINDIETGAIVGVNTTMSRMFGYSPEEATRVDIGTLSSGVRPYTGADAMERIVKAMAGEAQLFEWHSKHKDGHLFWTEVNLHIATIGGSRRSIVVVRDITQRKQIEAELLAEKNFTDTAINAMTGLFFVQNHEGKNVRWNRTLGDLLPKTQAERDAAPPLALIHPDDRAQVAETVREVFSDGYAETEARLSTDQERHFILNGRRMEIAGEPFLVGTGVEITERKRLQREVERSAAEWKQTFDTVHTPILVTERDGAIVRFNRAALELSGLAEGELAAKRVGELHEGEPWQTAAQLVSYIAGEGSGTVSQTKDADGRTWDLTIEHFSSPGDGAERFILVLWEITGIVELQESLRRSETMSAMGTLVAGVAHEVRNPLFGISATLDAYHDELSRPEYQECGETLRREVNRLIHLMKELLEYGKPPALSIERGSIADVVDEAIHSRRSAARAAQVSLKNLLNGDVPTLLMDRSRLRQVFENLIDNAVQHSDAGGEVVVSHSLVEQAGRPWVEYRVEDSGVGFAPNDLDRVFEPFFTRRDGGTGLGLSIVQRIVQEHAGRISAANRPEGGGMITLLLPLAENTGAPRSS
jgi:PAS domain S-box-containing protein